MRRVRDVVRKVEGERQRRSGREANGGGAGQPQLAIHYRERAPSCPHRTSHHNLGACVAGQLSSKPHMPESGLACTLWTQVQFGAGLEFG